MFNQNKKIPNFGRILPKYGIYDVTIQYKKDKNGKFKHHSQILQPLNRKCTNLQLILRHLA